MEREERIVQSYTIGRACRAGLVAARGKETPFGCGIGGSGGRELSPVSHNAEIGGGLLQFNPNEEGNSIIAARRGINPRAVG